MVETQVPSNPRYLYVRVFPPSKKKLPVPSKRNTSIWRLPNMGVPPNHQSLNGIFHDQPSWSTPIGNLHFDLVSWGTIPLTRSIYHQPKPGLVKLDEHVAPNFAISNWGTTGSMVHTYFRHPQKKTDGPLHFDHQFFRSKISHGGNPTPS